MMRSAGCLSVALFSLHTSAAMAQSEPLSPSEIAIENAYRQIDSSSKAVQLDRELGRLLLAVQDRRLVYVTRNQGIHNVYDHVVAETAEGAKCFHNPPLRLLTDQQPRLVDGDQVFPTALLKQAFLGFEMSDSPATGGRSSFYLIDTPNFQDLKAEGEFARLYGVRSEGTNTIVSARVGEVNICFDNKPAEIGQSSRILWLLGYSDATLSNVDDFTYFKLDKIYASNLSAPTTLAKTINAALAPLPRNRMFQLAEIAQAPPGSAPVAPSALPSDLSTCRGEVWKVSWYQTINCLDGPKFAAVSFEDTSTIIGEVTNRARRFMFNDPGDRRRIALTVSSDPGDAAIYFGGERSTYRTVTELLLTPDKLKVLRVIKEGYAPCSVTAKDLAGALAQSRSSLSCKMKALSRSIRSGRNRNRRGN